ncbi:hypothetical protein FIBSPDRAFT_758379 [Athelia psychrophila]|uniref:CxC2-like cysteine cluster KDZ transposase-associated domain-containing protein n=1 Tax=Athelia psychrophila TaxID=1759441 RepID=A0A165ZBS2_9AGAM|nr:hypothetical protein FIBSPDRAFT_758379 [Fibularhizoctonia sp. CBS 109695]
MLIYLDGRGRYTNHACGQCNASAPTIRCHNCHGGQLFCNSCIIASHTHNPTHRVECWNSKFFEHTTLKALGLRVRVGHAIGEHCINPTEAAGDDFVIIDTNGIHQVTLDFCGCTHTEKPTTQLLRAGLYPATVQAPKTAATVTALETFHLLMFESKASVFEFYNTLARQTDNTGTLKLPDRYDEFLRMMRQWRNLKMLKRAGRGHDPSGVAATQEGECAVVCPVCPQPGKNLEADWQEAPEGVQWLFALFLGINANFRMVRKKVSSEAADPTFSGGWSYFVEPTKYRDHIAKQGEQKEVRSTCVKHHTVNDANTGRFSNLASSGIGTVDCARHMFKRPNSVGDLQKGERYINMDYMFFSSTTHEGTEFEQVVISYDIACQWGTHLWDRMKDLPHRLHLDHENKNYVFLIPKFHLPAHVEKCQTAFSFNLTRGVGRTEGEAPEHGWSNINPVAASAKQMGPASYRETINDHFGDWNHSMIVNLGYLQLRKLKAAVVSRDDHVEDFYTFTESIPAMSVIDWTSIVESWEKDNSQVNPFVPTMKTITQHGVRLALAVEDAADLQKEDKLPVHDNVTPGILIVLGLELEAQQIKLKAECKALDASTTSRQLTQVQERKNSLRRKINSWTNIQHLYMPEVAALRAREDRAASDSGTEIQVYNIPLHFPSSLTQIRTNAKLYEYEFRLRRAQAYEALDELRQHLRLRSHMYKYKDRHVSGQRANTRSRNLITNVQRRVDASVIKYTSARTALTSLALHTGDVGWDSQLKELKDEDIRKKGGEKKGLGEGHKKLSWIWKVYGVAGDQEDKGIQEALRIEWCRARARAMRWSEEVILLREEMCHVLSYHEWHASWWESQAFRHTGLSPELAEGMAAYAAKQAAIRWSRASYFDCLWRTGWAEVQEGIGADNDVLDLPASHHFTSYPSSSCR